MRRVILAVLASTTLMAPPAAAQQNAREEAVRREHALATLPKDAARRIFGVVKTPAPGGPDVIGFYAKGCYTGGVQLPAEGDTWQVMRPSRNRAWGHPVLIAFLQRFSKKAADATGWPGLLIGDMSQPRGGPMLTGHASHQVGIEVDVWLRPAPNRRYSSEEREEILSLNLVRADKRDIDPEAYTRQHLALLKSAAREPEVARIFVNAAIKKALCRDAGSDRAWLSKVRPAGGHNYHFHIRMACPKGESRCESQSPPPGGDGCGKELDYWFTDKVLNPKPGKPGRPMSIAAMPAACQALVGNGPQSKAK
jgi:penicillin-insensitive murein endopeptidase